MSAASLRERVRFEARAASSGDDYGNEAGSWAEEFTVYARVQPLRGGEDVMAARLQGRQPVIIRVRSSSQTRQITPDWRAVHAHDGTVFNIRSIANMDEKNAFIDILAEAGVAV